jgi:hypothetical protein
MYGAQATAGLGQTDQAYNATPTPKAPPQITLRIEELARATETLHQNISELENRISAVLRPVPPSGEGGSTTQPTPDTAPLAMGIRELAARVLMAAQRIGALNSRVEL